MAYAALTSLSQTIDLILRYHQDATSPQLENQIIHIQNSAKSLQRFLEDSPDTYGWLEGRITEVVHEAEDIVEMLLSEQVHGSSVGPSKHLPEAEYKHLRYGFHDLERVTGEIESIIKELTGGDDFVEDHLSNEWSGIMDRLTGGPSVREVIAIVGMPGIGKTSLARKFYEHPPLMEYFDICGWATVSQDKELSEIRSELLVSIGKSDTGSGTMNLEELYKTLSGKRYLVVLDDIWDIHVWNALSHACPCNFNGSRIIITTRHSHVARCADSIPVYMSFMNEDQSWSLLHQKVFKRGGCPPYLKYIGKRIARLCRGHPLTISLISGILAADLTKDAWEGIAENLHANIHANYKSDYESLENILSLSYSHLPHHLRPCLLYMAAFPEDYEICVSKLIKLWVAEGFLELNGFKSFEEIGEEYLGKLIQRNLVLVIKWKSGGGIKCVSIHDLVRDICILKARKEDFFGFVKESHDEGIKNSRRLTMLASFDMSFFYGSRIHTIACLKNIELQCSFRYFRLLRILNLSNAWSSFPVEILDLFHLRYLSFRVEPEKKSPLLSNYHSKFRQPYLDLGIFKP